MPPPNAIGQTVAEANDAPCTLTSNQFTPRPLTNPGLLCLTLKLITVILPETGTIVTIHCFMPSTVKVVLLVDVSVIPE